MFLSFMKLNSILIWISFASNTDRLWYKKDYIHKQTSKRTFLYLGIFLFYTHVIQFVIYEAYLDSKKRLKNGSLIILSPFFLTYDETKH